MQKQLNLLKCMLEKMFFYASTQIHLNIRRHVLENTGASIHVCVNCAPTDRHYNLQSNTFKSLSQTNSQEEKLN